jgi:hypothetical protein
MRRLLIRGILPAVLLLEAACSSDDEGDAGAVMITLGGNVFGAAGGTVELPLAVDGDNVVTDSVADFLGNSKLSFEPSGGAIDGVFEVPPALVTTTRRPRWKASRSMAAR